MGQVQLLLEICNLEEAHFVQFKPGSLIYDEEFQITKVCRDRQWFQNNVKYMVDFVDTLQCFKNNTEMRNMLNEDDQIRFIHTFFKYNKKTRMFRKKTRKPIQIKQVPDSSDKDIVYNIDLSQLKDHVEEFLI
jgi:hypothetical protein